MRCMSQKLVLYVMRHVSGRQVALPSILLNKFKIIGSYLECVGSRFASPDKVGSLPFLLPFQFVEAFTVSSLFGCGVFLKMISNAMHITYITLLTLCLILIVSLNHKI